MGVLVGVGVFVAVLVEVSLWLAGAFNLVGLFVGIGATDGGWFFLVAHAVSTGLEAMFCTGCVVLTYQLCLRWFGHERLDNLMTAVQAGGTPEPSDADLMAAAKESGADIR